MKTCRVTECDRKHYGQGLCKMHLQRLRRNGSIEPLRIYGRTACSVEGCHNRHHAHDYCRIHLGRMTDHGSTESLQTRQPHCNATDCPREHYSKGFCQLHYERLERYGRLELLTTDDRFWAKVEPQGDCWIWTGAKTGGYGNFNNTFAHRYTYTSMVGEIPDGLQLDHLCRRRSCVNPYHLDPVTPAENTRRGWASRRKEEAAANA